MSNPFFPIPEVRKHTHPHHIDSFGERWLMVDGIETKVANLAAAKATLAYQDAVRIQIRADLDALGIRDQTVKTEITLEDGTKTTVELLPPGAASFLQFDAKRMTVHVDTAFNRPIRPEPKTTHWQRVKKFFRRKAH